MKKAAYKLFLAMVVVPAMIGASATFPPQIRPADPSAFVGTWEGSWHSTTHGTSGPVQMTIHTPGNDGLLPAEFQYYFNNKPSPLFQGKWKFENGELLLASLEPSCFSKLPISLHGDGSQQKHEWNNTCTNNAGWSSLTRKK